MNIFQLIEKSKNRKEAQKIFELLLTEKELYSLEERVKILTELSKGNTQRQVASNLNCSVVTVTRGAKVYNKNKDFFDSILK
ncbi:MAG: transcriptional regulator [Flavobacteriales bacterium]|nr:transcriptional regulator [Flavobacteriales bacterium]